MLSAYVNPSLLNGNLTGVSAGFTGKIFPDGLDKRATGGLNTVVRTTTQVVDLAADVADTVSNALGLRSNLYIIGELRDGEDGDSKQSGWVNSNQKGLVRAITDTNASLGRLNGYKQEGVIIDGIGDVSAVMAVEFTKNPTIFLGDNIVDGRYRVPTTVKMTVLVSDYLADDWKEMIAQTLDAWDPTGIASQFSFLGEGGNTRAQAKLIKLKELMLTGRPFTLYTPHGIYENMLIKSLRPKTDDEKMDMLYCDVEFSEVLLYTEYMVTPGTKAALQGTSAERAGFPDTAVEKVKKIEAAK